MQDNHRSQVKIRGDGNAVGDHNQITVIKQDNRRYGGSGKGGDEPNLVGPAMIFLAFAMVMGSYYFARNANSVYILLRVMSGAEASIALLATTLFIQRDGYAIAAKMGVVSILSIIASATLYDAHNNYPVALTSLANASNSMRDFWCGLSIYGRQLALLHASASTIGIGLGSLLLLPVTLGIGFFSLFPVAVTERTYHRVESLTSWGLVIAATPLVFAAFYAHTPAGQIAWTVFIGDPPTLVFCPNRK